MAAPHRLFATCAPGLEPLLAAELEALGALDVEPGPGGCSLRGHRKLIMRVNLWSGVASHVYLRIGEFVATRFEAIVDGIAALPLEDFLRPGVPRSFKVHAHKSRLIHSDAIAERAARAIASRLGDAFDQPTDDGVPIQIRLHRDHARISVDTSGEALNRRGYRLDPGLAPLREDLSHALVLASGWDPTTPFVDPMAGSGTLAIEAARIAKRIAPGYNRGFAFERSPVYHEPTWRELRKAAKQGIRETLPSPIVAADRSTDALETLRANAERAGVLGDLRIEAITVGKLPLEGLGEHGALVTHPPFGKRLNEGALEPLYKTLGARARELAEGWKLALAVGDAELGKLVDERLEVKAETRSGGAPLLFLAR